MRRSFGDWQPCTGWRDRIRPRREESSMAKNASKKVRALMIPILAAVR
jgi:hypothetical protein